MNHTSSATEGTWRKNTGRTENLVYNFYSYAIFNKAAKCINVNRSLTQDRNSSSSPVLFKGWRKCQMNF